MKVYNARTLQEVAPSGEDPIVELWRKLSIENLKKVADKYTQEFSKLNLETYAIGDNVLLYMTYAPDRPYDVIITEIRDYGIRGEYLTQAVGENKRWVGLFPFDSIIKGTPVEKKEKEDKFLWLTRKGDFLYVPDMETNHLFNAFRMLYNHGVPPAFRVGAFIRRPDVFEWSREYKEQAFDAMRAELKKREGELSIEQKEELDDIGQNARAFALLAQDEDPENPMVGEPYNVD